jgi:hypothetical protein
MILQKDKSIIELVDALNLDEKGWTISDHWDGDMCAIGIASKSRPSLLVYVSTFDLPSGRFYFECEVAEAEGELRYASSDSAANVDFAALERKMIDHLGVNDRPASNSQQKLPQASVKS